MDTNSPVQQPEQPVVTASPGIFGTRTPSLAAFITGVLLFFLPFVDIKCNNMSLMQFSGMELAFGVKTGNQWDMQNERFDGNAGEESFKGVSATNERRSSNKFALIALSLGVLGVVVCFAKARSGGMAAFVVGMVAVVFLIALLIDLKQKVKQETPSANELDRTMYESIDVGISFGVGFWLAMAAFAGAAQAGYKRWKLNRK